MAAGRPTKYSLALAHRICELTATHSWGLDRLCATFPELPDSTTVYLWRSIYPEFSTIYAQAKLKQAEILAEEILQIADDASGDIKYDKDGNESLNGEFVARSRLRIDTRKWLAAKLLPKAYGDKKQVEETNPADTLNKIQALVADLNKTNVSDI